MSDLVSFLIARLDEDEQVARDAEAEPFPDKGFQRGTHIVYGLQSTGLGLAYQGFALAWDPARVLAEVAAKRKLLAGHEAVHRCDWGEHRGGELEPCSRAKLLAAPYADHPDFDGSWRT